MRLQQKLAFVVSGLCLSGFSMLCLEAAIATSIALPAQSTNVLPGEFAQTDLGTTDSADALDRASRLLEEALGLSEQEDTEAALVLAEEALALQISVLGENHSALLQTVGFVASLHYVLEDYTAAQSNLEQALSIYEESGEDSPFVLFSILGGLGDVYLALGYYEGAQSILEIALSIPEFETDSISSVSAVGLLAQAHQNQGNYSQALALYERMMGVYKTLWKDASGTTGFIMRAVINALPTVASTLNRMALTYWAQGDVEQAVLSMSRASNIEEQAIVSLLLNASEAKRQRYFDVWNKAIGSINLSVSLNLLGAPESEAATQLAFETVLRRKGRGIDDASKTFESVRSQLTSESKALVDELGAIYSTIASLHFSASGSDQPNQTDIEALRSRAEEIQSLLATTGATQLVEEILSASDEQFVDGDSGFSLGIKPISIKTIQSALPQQGALIEFVRYVPYSPARLPEKAEEVAFEPRYAAYILPAEGKIKSVDLGEAAVVDQLITQFRTELITRASTVKNTGRQLDAQLMEPIRAALGEKTHLVLAPDADLNLIPFDGLVDEQDNYLIETYQLSYLTSGRELLKQGRSPVSRQPSVLIANPDYEVAETSVTATESPQENVRSVDASTLSFSALPGTLTEIESIAPYIPDAAIYTEARATERNLKQVKSPKILHVATHGFFLPDVPFVPSKDSRNRGLGASLDVITVEEPPQVSESNLENPLLRSGLALAGANAKASGEEDGILTALEVSTLDLQGTQLVVLSACETGLGAVSNGEGVYGLRRTFAIAGAQSQLMSLWQVDDAGTSELMQIYYENLITNKQGRSEALRNAQLEMMNTGTYSHPYYWSSFIFSGDWRPLGVDN